MNLYPLGDSAVVIELGKEINEQIHHKVRVLSAYLDEHPFPGMVEYVPAFTTVTVFYDPVQFGSSPYRHVCTVIKNFAAGLSRIPEEEPRIVEIPVCYGGEFGPDLEFVADHNGLTPEEVISIHSSGDYLVYMVGFAPGFPYLGGMPGKIATPRRSSPRLSIPAGTVGIGGTQTGVYPIETPGGWQLIGRTPLPLFRSNENPPALLQAGDRIRFRPISRQEYAEQKETPICL
ncbi:5-oxoprolinase subunit PxpB [Aneurinibacillus tyrosinisolvens]|uniref:5-oxoprolinase subunit PxpB n=1 Tax=Aneurinibacillus tyrosinisolvens TaxID=1443435 RepID=UPI00063F284E|nr:5-oxoprolinase subunit PxpB [Aneurinibacillus tyrosinisolvens]